MNSNDMREEANNVWQKAYNTFIHSPVTDETISAVREARMVFNAAEEAAAQQAQQEIPPDSYYDIFEDVEGCDEEDVLLDEMREETRRLQTENDQLRLDFAAEIRERRAAVCERDVAIRERDEARREVCLEASTDASGCYISGKHILVAEDRGWDCYNKEPHVGEVTDMPSEETQ